MSLKLVCKDEMVLISLLGDIDMEDAVNLRNAVFSLMQEGHCRVILDLRRVEHINATCIGILADAQRRLRHAGGDLRLAHLSPYMDHALELMGVRGIFHVDPDVESARARLQPLQCAAA